MLMPSWAPWAMLAVLATAAAQEYRVQSAVGEFAKYKESIEQRDALTRWAAEQREAITRRADVVAQEKIDEAKQKALEFERCIAAGTGCGLRVKIRPATASLPATGGSCVGGAGEQTAELADSARPDHRALRAGILEVEEALKVCLGSK